MSEEIKVPTMSEFMAQGKQPEVLFWVGCAGSFDDRAKKITKAFVKILNKANVEFAVLGTEESCTGDPAKRSGNEFLFQMQAVTNIDYEVVHHTQFLKGLLDDGRLTIEGGQFKGKRITFHDPCYLGRANNVYEAPRDLIRKLDAELVEMKNCKKNGLCCGAGGAQMFKEPEKGDKDINVERTEQALETKPEIIAAGCPFCNTMMTDGIKTKESDVTVMDVAELIANAQDL
jgi:Fe-S oxidoreductase